MQSSAVTIGTGPEHVWVLLAAPHEADPERTRAWYLPEAAGKAFLAINISRREFFTCQHSAGQSPFECMSHYADSLARLARQPNVQTSARVFCRKRNVSGVWTTFPDESAINVENIEVSSDAMHNSQDIWLASMGSPLLSLVNCLWPEGFRRCCLLC